MAKIALYPAIFQKEETGYFVKFPDLEGCVTQGESIEESIMKAHEVLAFYLDDFDLNNLPQASDITKIEILDDSFPSIISVDMLEYRKKHKNKAVKKTLSIPQWLNEIALKENLNFSQILQDAIIEKLKLQ